MPDRLSDAHHTDPLTPLIASWRRHLAAQKASPATMESYTISAGQLRDYLLSEGMPTDPASIAREHVQAFITDLLARWKPATAHNRYRGCGAFFKWLVDEGEIEISPMARMRPPRLSEAPPTVLREPDLRALIEICAKDRTFAGRRDEAIIRTFIDTGCRRGELLGLQTGDVDLDTGLLKVTGKGSRTRHVVVGVKTVRALDRYLRARVRHPHSGEPWLWLGAKGRLRESGLADLVSDRGRQAGIVGAGRLHPHMFRHAYAHAMLAAGMQESDLMAVVGWRSREMVTRYAASTRAERALNVARTLSPGDKL